MAKLAKIPILRISRFYGFLIFAAGKSIIWAVRKSVNSVESEFWPFRQLYRFCRFPRNQNAEKKFCQNFGKIGQLAKMGKVWFYRFSGFADFAMRSVSVRRISLPVFWFLSKSLKLENAKMVENSDFTDFLIFASVKSLLYEIWKSAKSVKSEFWPFAKFSNFADFPRNRNAENKTFPKFR